MKEIVTKILQERLVWVDIVSVYYFFVMPVNITATELALYINIGLALSVITFNVVNTLAKYQEYKREKNKRNEKSDVQGNKEDLR